MELKERIIQLYNNGTLDSDGLLKAVSNGWLTVDEAASVVGGESTEIIKKAKLTEISAACNAEIIAGIDVKFDESSQAVHFNLSIEDQSNINNLFRVVELGGTEYPYQADGGVCRIYTAQEIAQIYLAAQTLITTQTTYHNTLKAYVQSLTDADDIEAVQYGMELPEEYAQEMNSKLAVAQHQMQEIVAKLSAHVSNGTDGKVVDGETS